jgi:hypothetical protein
MFDIQYKLGGTPIEKVQIPTYSRDELPPAMAALQYIYTTPELNKAVYALVEPKIRQGKKRTGRNGMTGWEILVLSVARMTLDIDYDQLLTQANYNILIRQIMGIEDTFGGPSREFKLQTLRDNMKLLTVEDINKVNELVVSTGQKFAFKKKELLAAKCDSYVLESNIHFPTDLNLLWDSCRKILDTMDYCVENYELKGWRKAKQWRRKVKSAFRSAAKASSANYKEDTVRSFVEEYLRLAEGLLEKSEESMADLLGGQELSAKVFAFLMALEYYQQMAAKHIDLVDRRLLKGEKIPQSEKIYSIFEPHVEWLSKGKLNKKVELGHKLLITTDQYNFIIDHQVVYHQADAQLAIEVADRLLAKYKKVKSLSMDKGFYSKANKELISQEIETVVMPKKGRKNQTEQQEEASKEFKSLRHKHSAIESNINELEHHGLNKCPDKGQYGFEKYVAMGVLSYNLNKLGKILLSKVAKPDKKKQAA